MKRIINTALVLLSTTFLVAEEITVPKTALQVNDVNKTENITKLRDFNVALKLGTLGLGFDVSTPINDKLSARFNLNGASYTDTDSQDGNDFEGTLDLMTAGILLDYYPFENNFRLSGGAYYNGNGFEGNVKPSATTTVDINGKEYNIGDIGSLDSKIKFDKVAPYIGLGWGNDTHDKGWGFTFDLGVLYHGEGKGTLTPKDLSPLIDRAELDRNVKNEEQNINDDLSDYRVYPVVSLGVNYSF